jgi:hypothetical protein
MVVKISPEVLDSVASELTAMSGKLPGLLSRARGLDVSWAVSGLADAPAWAEDTTVDLRARLGLVRMINSQTVNGLNKPGPFNWLDIAGARAPVATSLTNLHSLETQPSTNATWARRPNESLDDWITRLQGQALDQFPMLDGAGQPIAEAYSWWNDYLSVLAAGGFSSLAAVTIGRTQLARAAVPRLEALYQAGRISEKTLANFKARYTVYKAPGTTIQGLIQKIIPYEKLNGLPPKVTQWLVGQGLMRGLPVAEGALPGEAASALKLVFGSEWIDPRTVGGIADDIVRVPRGASNLAEVGRLAPWGEKLGTLGRTAGFLRGAGVVGGVMSTGFDVANLVSEGNPVEAFKRDKAGYVADVSQTLFDASLTAAIIAPNPVTWGAVAVTGVVYAGAELVDHWDDVSHAASEAADWTGDRLSDVGDAVSDSIDKVKDSKVNPMNWF